jgi:hypothetical protein
MLRTSSLLLLGIVLLAGTSAAADDAYSLKLYQSKTGDKTEHETTKDEKTAFVVAAGGKENKNAAASSSKEVYTEEVLDKAAGDKRATKLVRVYTVAEKTEKGKTAKSAYVGQPVLIEKKGEGYEISVKGKPLTEAEAPDLFKKFKAKKDDEPRNEDFLPPQPVKVGESWAVAADKSEQMFKSLGEEKMKIDAKKSTIGGKLLKAYKKDGGQFGVLELTMTVVVTDLDLGGQFAKTTAGSKVVLKGTVDTCIDGTVPFEDSKIEVTVDIGADLPNGGTLTISSKSAGVEKVRASKK